MGFRQGFAPSPSRLRALVLGPPLPLWMPLPSGSPPLPVLARLLLLALLVAASGPAAATAQPDAQPGTSKQADGLAVNPLTNSLYRFETQRGEPDLITIDVFGAPPGGLNPRASLVLPDTALASITLPVSTLRLIVRGLDGATGALPDTPDFGYTIDRDHLRIQFDQGVPFWALAAAILGLLIAGGGGVGLALTARERRRRQAEAEARQRALHAREAERTRIARELHDGPLQDVHALRFLGAAADNPEVGAEASRIATELRAIAEGLRPPALGRFGLAAALAAHANRVKDRHPAVTIALDLDEDARGDDALPDLVRSALFRIAQEAVTNAIEHGGATTVRIALRLPSPPDGRAPIVLDVADDGSGLEGPLPDLSALADDGHFGLVGMHERAEAIGGRLTLAADGIGDRGVHVRVSTPDPRHQPTARSRRRLAPA